MTSHPLHVPAGLIGFNTASGMRSHVTRKFNDKRSLGKAFQYRKRYEVTCDYSTIYGDGRFLWGFNTVSGMRSHVTKKNFAEIEIRNTFQYRKRYEVTCDTDKMVGGIYFAEVSIPQAV